MKSIFLTKQTFWFLSAIAILTPIGCRTREAKDLQSWQPTNPQLQSLYDGCKNLENLGFIFKTLFEGTHLNEQLKKTGGSFFGILLNLGSIGMKSIQLLEEDLPQLRTTYTCMAKSENELKDMYQNNDQNDCSEILCVNKQSCLGSTIRETAQFLTPLMHNLLGKVIDTPDAEGQNKTKYHVESGLILNLNEFAQKLLTISLQTNATKILGNTGTQALESLQKNLQRLKTVLTALSVTGNDMLFALETIAPIIGGKDYLDAMPNISQEQRRDLLEQSLEFDPAELDLLEFDDFLI